MRAWAVRQFRHGLTPRKLAWCVALGVVLGLFPALGLTTLLCFVAATAGRLNQPAIQTVNYAMYPLQLVLLIPFFKAGALLFHEPSIHLTMAQIRRLIGAGIGPAIAILWTTTWHGIVVWMLMGIPLTLLLVSILRRILERIAARPALT